MHKCYNNRAYMHGYYSAAFYILLIFLVLHLTLFFSLDPLTFISLLPPPISIALDKRRRCNHQPSNTQPPSPHGKPKSYQTQLKPTEKPIPNPILLLLISPCQYRCRCYCCHQIYRKQARLGQALLMRASSEKDERDDG